jgi:hypothetical protein
MALLQNSEENGSLKWKKYQRKEAGEKQNIPTPETSDEIEETELFNTQKELFQNQFRFRKGSNDCLS